MQNDEMIWQVLNQQFCSFKTTIGGAKEQKGQRQHFCSNEYSVTGLCSRQSCPLANSKYATVRQEAGRITLFIKSPERAHTPKDLWDKIKLSRNYSKALSQVDENLAYFPPFLVQRIKQRLTKIYQSFIRMRKVELKKRAGKGVKYTRVLRKVDQREERRERKAMIAANLEHNIESELIGRLSKGTYGDMYKMLENPEEEADATATKDGAEYEFNSDDEYEKDGHVEYVEGPEDESEDEDESESEDEEELEFSDYDSDSYVSDAEEEEEEELETKIQKKASKIKRGAEVEIEYEDEEDDEEERHMGLADELAW